MGCFWGPERLFWGISGVFTTAVAFCGGHTSQPTYKEVCSGSTGHAEVVRIVYMRDLLPLEQLLTLFWEHHDPTQGMRQWNDQGTQYRSMINMWDSQQETVVMESYGHYRQRLQTAGMAPVTTGILLQAPSFLAEPEHQQYLYHHPHGYCSMRGCGITYDP
jgi:peptide-methionine (S)-S-oxide reductase